MTGRPSLYTQEIADEICERLIGGESLRRICLDDHLPDARTVHRWLVVNEAFRQQYAHAKEIQADTKFEEAWEIASSATPEDVQVARLKVDTIKWQTGKLAPKKYGDKIQQEVSGPDGGPVMLVTGVPRAND